MVSVSHRFACPAGCEFTAVKWSVMKMHLTSPELTCRWVVQCFPNQCRALSENKIDAVKESVSTFGDLVIWKVPTTVALSAGSMSANTIWSAEEWRVGNMGVMLSYDCALGVPGPLASCVKDAEGTLIEYRTAVCAADSMKVHFSPWRAEIVKSTVFLHQRVTHDMVSTAATPEPLWVCVEARSDASRRVGGTVDVDDTLQVAYWTPPQVECGLCVSEVFTLRGLQGCFERQLSPGVVRAYFGRAAGVTAVTAMCHREKCEKPTTSQCVTFTDEQKFMSIECAYESDDVDVSERVVLRVVDVCGEEAHVDSALAHVVLTDSPSLLIKARPAAPEASPPQESMSTLGIRSADSTANAGTDIGALDSVKDKGGEEESRDSRGGGDTKNEVPEREHVDACMANGHSQDASEVVAKGEVDVEPEGDGKTRGEGAEMADVSGKSKADDQAACKEDATATVDLEATVDDTKPNGASAANGVEDAKPKDESATKSEEDVKSKDGSATKCEDGTKPEDVSATKCKERTKAKREEDANEHSGSASDSVCGSSSCSGWVQRKHDAIGLKHTGKGRLHTPPPGFAPPSNYPTTPPAFKVIGHPVSPAVGVKKNGISVSGVSSTELYRPRVSPQVVGSPLSSTKVGVLGKKAVPKGEKGKSGVGSSDKQGGKSSGKGKHKGRKEDWTASRDWGWEQGEWVDSGRQSGKGMTAEEKKAARQKVAEEKKAAQKKAAEEKKDAQKKTAEEKKEAQKKTSEDKKEAQQKAAEEKKRRVKDEAERKVDEKKLRDKVLMWVKNFYIQHWQDSQNTVRWRIVLKRCDLDDAMVRAIVAYVDTYVTQKSPEKDLSHLFENVDIAENKITDEGADCVLDLLNSPNVSWMRLSLYNNALTDRTALRISETLKVMAVAPTELHLSDCKITDVGFLALLDALKANKAFPRVDRNKWPVPLWLQLRRNQISRACIQKCQQEHVICDASQRDCCHIHYCRFAKLHDMSSPLLHLKNITEQQSHHTIEKQSSVWQ
eukprot:GEMP01003558.1.p1 GENE.GEMP01003558.1~~GEMP01003558.1.p1  ORF type:complete len:1008 (+),score=320.39 GEMP01003558.1:357-3380(+)